MTSAVSKLTVMLVTDGSFAGGKLARAQQFGTRQVHPDTFEVLLRHLQPAVTRAPTRDRNPAVTVQGPSTSDSSSVSPPAVRAWAAAAGLEVGVRGRLPRHVLDAYAAAH